MAPFIAACGTLKYFALSGNDVGASAGEDIAAAVCESQSLCELYLDSTGATDLCAQILIIASERNPNLIRIDLSCNKLAYDWHKSVQARVTANRAKRGERELHELRTTLESYSQVEAQQLTVAEQLKSAIVDLKMTQTSLAEKKTEAERQRVRENEKISELGEYLKKFNEDLKEKRREMDEFDASVKLTVNSLEKEKEGLQLQLKNETDEILALEMAIRSTRVTIAMRNDPKAEQQAANKVEVEAGFVTKFRTKLKAEKKALFKFIKEREEEMKKKGKSISSSSGSTASSSGANTSNHSNSTGTQRNKKGESGQGVGGVSQTNSTATAASSAATSSQSHPNTSPPSSTSSLSSASESKSGKTDSSSMNRSRPSILEHSQRKGTNLLATSSSSLNTSRGSTTSLANHNNKANNQRSTTSASSSPPLPIPINFVSSLQKLD